MRNHYNGGGAMTQTDLFRESYRPRPDDLFKPGTQNHLLYERLLQGPTTNGEIIYEMRIANSTGRISELRAKLRDYLIDVKAERVQGSSFLYRLVG